MADQAFKNVIDGKLVDSVSGERYDVIDPTTGEVYATAPMSGAEDVDRAYGAAAEAFEAWGDTTPKDRSTALLKIADAIDARADEINAVECKDTGKPLGLTMSEEMPYASDHFRFFAGAARVLEGKSAGEYMADHTSFVRREPIGVVGQVTPVELPADDDDLEDRPGAGRRQHRRAQAVATPRRRPRRCSPSCARSSCRRACSTSCAATATPVARWSSTRRRRWSRSPARCARAWRSPARRPPTSSGCTSSSAARRRSSSSTTPTSRRPPQAIAEAGYFNAGQDCTAATRVLAGPGVHDDFVAALTEAAKGTRTGHARRRGRALRRPQQRRPAHPGDRDGRPAARPRHPQHRRHAAGRRGYFYEPDRAVRPAPGRRADPDRDLRPGHHRPEVQRRGGGARLGQRRAVRPGLLGLDQGPRPRDADVEEARLRRASGSTPTSRSSPRCRTAASSTPATARTSRCTASRTTPASST